MHVYTLAISNGKLFLREFFFLLKLITTHPSIIMPIKTDLKQSKWQTDLPPLYHKQLSQLRQEVCWWDEQLRSLQGYFHAQPLSAQLPSCEMRLRLLILCRSSRSLEGFNPKSFFAIIIITNVLLPLSSSRKKKKDNRQKGLLRASALNWIHIQYLIIFSLSQCKYETRLCKYVQSSQDSRILCRREGSKRGEAVIIISSNTSYRRVSKV